MNIFEQILIIFLLSGCVFPLLWWRWRQRLRYLQKMAKLNILQRQQKIADDCAFNSYIIDISVKKLYTTTDKQTQKALAQLAGGRISAAVKILVNFDKDLSLLLNAHLNPSQAFEKIKKKSLKYIINSRYNVFLIQLMPDLAKFEQLSSYLQTSKIKPKSKILRAYINLLLSRRFAHNGDMYPASELLYAALPVFHRHQYFMEEAECYMQLAEIYRLCCITDTAAAMLSTAQKIYKHFKLPLLRAKTHAIKAMLHIADNRYNEAEDCYLKALQSAPNDKIRAYILNHYAVLDIHRQQYSAAKHKIKQAHQFYILNRQPGGEAFCWQLLGQIAYEQQLYPNALKHLQKAAKNYLISKNYTAYAECEYISAETYFKQNLCDKAEIKLHTILKYAHLHQLNFHLGHVYSLLGLIAMQQNDFSAAEDWFKKSVWLEQDTKRYEGAAVDCVNLALLKQLKGDIISADQYIAEALEYAAKTENTDLIELIKSKTPKLK